jgi:hypothetical protein
MEDSKGIVHSDDPGPAHEPGGKKKRICSDELEPVIFAGTAKSEEMRR